MSKLTKTKTMRKYTQPPVSYRPHLISLIYFNMFGIKFLKQSQEHAITQIDGLRSLI